MLKMELSPGQGISIDGGRIKIILEDKTGRRARLSIEAERSISVTRIKEDGESIKSRDHP